LRLRAGADMGRELVTPPATPDQSDRPRVQGLRRWRFVVEDGRGAPEAGAEHSGAAAVGTAAGPAPEGGAPASAPGRRWPRRLLIGAVSLAVVAGAATAAWLLTRS